MKINMCEVPSDLAAKKPKQEYLLNVKIQTLNSSNFLPKNYKI